MNKEEFDKKYPKGQAYCVIYSKRFADSRLRNELWFRYSKEAKEFRDNLKDVDFVIFKKYSC